MRGNAVEIEGCSFSLASPAITTESKSKFMLNQYERPEREAVRRFVDPELPVVELGGSIGVVSCLTNRKLRNPERHVVVEANPGLVPLLLLNRDRNGCRFTVLPRLVAYGRDHAPFYASRGNFVIGSGTGMEGRPDVDVVGVDTVSLRSIVEENSFERCTLICDIEGGESDLFRYESDIVRDRVATLILEVHEWAMSKERVEEVLKGIEALGFRTVFSEADTYAFQKEVFRA